MCKGWKFQNRFFFVDVRAAENCGSLCAIFFAYFFFLIPISGILKKTKNIKKEKKKMLKSNSTKSSTGYDRIEFYIDFVQVLLSAFMLGYVVGKKKKERDA